MPTVENAAVFPGPPFSPSDFTFEPLLLVFRSHFWKVRNRKMLIVVSFHWVVKWWRIFFSSSSYFLVFSELSKKTLMQCFPNTNKKDTQEEKRKEMPMHLNDLLSLLLDISLLPDSPVSWKHPENRSAKSSAPHSSQHLSHSRGRTQTGSVRVCRVNEEYSGNI